MLVTDCQQARRHPTKRRILPRPRIEDCKAAVRWLRANAKRYGLNPTRIGTWGPSAGGHLVALLGTTGGVKKLKGTGGNLDQCSCVQCVVDWFGPTDLATMGGRYDKPDSLVARLIGGPVQKDRKKAAKASPVHYVTKDAALPHHARGPGRRGAACARA